MTIMDSIAAAPVIHPSKRTIPRLEAGDRLDQRTFHERYLAMPPDFRAELVEGVVIVPSPLLWEHGTYDNLYGTLLCVYTTQTPGTSTADNATAILGDEAEPQPDGAMIIEPACGGQTRFEGGYLVGAPEHVAEIASSSESYDMHGKFRDYQRAGVLEYVVVLLRQRRMRWFDLQSGAFAERQPDEEGVLRSRVFPGLWLNAPALIELNGAQVLATLQAGLASPEHAAFVEELRRRRASEP
jgi:Uma2 family endonuclease